MKNLFLLTLILLFVSCRTKEIQKESKNNEYAQHFQINSYKNFKILKIIEPWRGAKNRIYILSKNPEKIPDSLRNYPTIKIPVKNLIVTSTTHLEPLRMLNETDQLIGFPNTQYISSEIFRKKIKEGKIQDIGNGAGLNTEKTLMLKPNIILAFSSGNDFKNYEFFEKRNIPVLYNADWMEPTPLGRAEWIKVFGALFAKEEQAKKIFDKTVKNYSKIKKNIQNKKEKVRVFQGGIFGDKWYVPGGKSYAAKLIKDAGGEYVLKNDSHEGSFVLNFENAMVQIKNSDVWINPGSIISKSAIQKIIPQAKQFKSFQNNSIYTYAMAKGKTGGLIYFETSGMHPDWVLSDLYHIFYPQETPHYKFHYYSVLLP